MDKEEDFFWFCFVWGMWRIWLFGQEYFTEVVGLKMSFSNSFSNSFIVDGTMNTQI